jgi:3-oxoacyl-[acyl-carrier-protein] synthase II
MSERRVVVTGMGTANPLGLDPESSWAAALQGQSGVAPITLFDRTAAPVQFAAEVKAFEASRLLPLPIQGLEGNEPLTMTMIAKDVKKFGRFIHLGVHAGLQAYQDSGLDAHRSKMPAPSLGVNVGVGLGGLPEIQSIHADFMEKGYRRISPFFILQVIPNIVSGQLSVLLGLQGPNHCNVTACASSAHSIGESYRMIKHGSVQVMLAGGSEAVVCELGIGGFAAMKALSVRNDEPQRASRPFDKDRDGFVLGEGSTVLVLEEREQALARGAKIYGEILGYGASADAYHLVHPAPEAAGASRAMASALEEARLKPSQVDYVNAHATSTPAGDVEEARAIGKLMGSSRDRKLLVSSTKSMTGHLLGAAGATEAMFSLLALRDQVAPPTANLDNLDPDCAHPGLDFVAGKGAKAPLNVALSNSFGFGGTNGALVMGRA